MNSPEVVGGQHLAVVHDLTLVGGDLQRGQHVVHPRQAGGGAGRGAVEAPLQDVEAGPAGDVGALCERSRDPGSVSLQQTNQRNELCAFMFSHTCTLSPSLQVSAFSTML